MLPEIDLSKCTDCKYCIMDCIAEAIDWNSKEIKKESCFRCGHCMAICPEQAVSMNGVIGEKLTPPPSDMHHHFESLVKSRRSLRNYTKQSIDKEIINRILHTTNYSPTGTNSRKVGITVLDSREKIKELADIIMRHFDLLSKIVLNPLTRLILPIFIGREKTKKIFSYKKRISQYWEGTDILTHDAPLVMIFHTDKKSSTPNQDGLIWATTAMFHCETLGIGTCFNGFLVIGINTSRKARKFLRLPPAHKVNETFTAGYPTFQYQREITRRDLNATFI